MPGLRKPMRLCFFGDSMVNGTGDDSCLGWVGRICASARRGRCDVTCYNLGIRRDTSADVLARWQREARARLLPDHDGRLIFSFGTNDCCPDDELGRVRILPTRSMANAEAILVDALAWRPTLMVGPLPICDTAVDGRIKDLSAAYAALCGRLGVPYLEVFHIAAASAVWAREVAAGDGAHPNAAGYSLIADTVETWPAWRSWVD